MRASVLLALASLQIFLFPGNTLAYVPVEILPELTVGGGYDDNILLSTGEGEGDFVWRAVPRLSLAFPLKRMDMTLDQSYYYYYNGEQGEKQSYQVQSKISMYIIKDLLIYVADRYLLIPVEVGRPAYSPINLTRANELVLGALFDYDLSPTTSSQWKYDFVRADFYDELRAAYYAHKASLRLAQEVTESLSLYLDYSYFDQMYTLGKTSSLVIHQGAAGLILLFHGLTGDMSFGSQSLESSEAGRANGSFMKIDLRYPVSERLEAKATYTQAMSVEVTGRTFNAKSVQAGTTYVMSPRIQTSLQGTWGNYSFHGLPLHREYWGVQAGAQYEIVTDTSLSFIYDHYDGRDDGGNVIDNRYFLELRWTVQ